MKQLYFQLKFDSGARTTIYLDIITCIEVNFAIPEPDFAYLEALGPFQPLHMRVCI